MNSMLEIYAVLW